MLSLDLVFEDLDAEEAAAIVRAELRQRPGLFGVSLTIGDWQAPGVVGLLDACAETPILSSRTLGDPSGWPSAEINWIIDASSALRGCESEHALALRLGASPWLPTVQDLIVELDDDEMPPKPGMLDMLVAATKACAMFVYVNGSYPYRGLLLTYLASSSSAWAVRCR